VLQSGSLDSTTTQKTDFKPFDVTKVVKTESARPIQTYHSTKGQFDGTTTNRKDYLAYPLPPKFQRKAAEYVKTDAMLDAI
jgi:hypothetical protein